MCLQLGEGEAATLESQWPTKKPVLVLIIEATATTGKGFSSGPFAGERIKATQK